MSATVSFILISINNWTEKKISILQKIVVRLNNLQLFIYTFGNLLNFVSPSSDSYMFLSQTSNLIDIYIYIISSELQ